MLPTMCDILRVLLMQLELIQDLLIVSSFNSGKCIFIISYNISIFLLFSSSRLYRFAVLQILVLALCP